MSSPSAPGPLVPPPRSGLTVRHMVGAVLALVAMVLVVGGLKAGSRPSTSAVDRGTVEAGGVTWVVYDDGTDEPIRIADVPTPGAGTVRMLITGSDDDDFRALAQGAVAGEVLTR